MPNRSIPLSLLIGSAVIFASGAAFAGFEWVPPAGQQLQQAPAAAANDTTPPPAAQAPLEPVTAAPLMPTVPATPVAALPVQPVAVVPPLPSGLPVSMPAPQRLVVPTPVAAAPVIQQAPVPAPVPTPAPAPVLYKMPAPQPQQAAAQQAPEENAPVFIKVRKVEGAPPPVARNAPPAEPVPILAAPMQEPPAQQPQITWNPPPQEEEKPLLINPTPVAPAAGDERPQLSNKLVINPYPQKTARGATPAPVMQARIEPPTAPAGIYSTVEGFGSDMPLAIALPQIAPPDYVFAFGDNVNPGANISWDGNGRPWNEVISSAVAPLGLEVRIEGKTVHIASGMEQQGSAIMPQAGGEEMSLTESDLRRSNVTDPGESPKKQPLSTPVTAEEKPAAAPEAPATNEAEALPLLPEDTAAAPAPGGPVVVRGIWEVHQGDSLKETLDEWSKKANVELVWNATHDYTIESDMTMNDSFQTAVQAVVAHGVKADKPVVKLENDGKNGRTGILTVQDKT